MTITSITSPTYLASGDIVQHRNGQFYRLSSINFARQTAVASRVTVDLEARTWKWVLTVKSGSIKLATVTKLEGVR